MVCDEVACLDKRENTKVVFGSSVMKLDEFEEMKKSDPNLKKKMDEIEKELKTY